MSADLFRLVYCSNNTISAGRGDPAAQIADILSASRANNARDGVTGALLYSDGCFAQVLEGPLHVVQRTFERIQRDPRHGEVIVLEAGRVQARVFGEWSMASAEPSDPAGTQLVLSQALAEPDDDRGTTVVALLDSLVRRQQDWASAA